MELEEASEIESNNDDKYKPEENTKVQATETVTLQTNDEGNTEPDENTEFKSKEIYGPTEEVMAVDEKKVDKGNDIEVEKAEDKEQIQEATIDEKEQEDLNMKAFQQLIRMPEYVDQSIDTRDLLLEACLNNTSENESLQVKLMELEIDLECLTTEMALIETEMENELTTVRNERNEVR